MLYDTKESVESRTKVNQQHSSDCQDERELSITWETASSVHLFGGR